MVRIRYVHMGLWKLPRFGAFFVLKGTAFRCFILEPVPDVPLVRLWGSIGTRIPIWDVTSGDVMSLHLISRASFPSLYKKIGGMHWNKEFPFCDADHEIRKKFPTQIFVMLDFVHLRLYYKHKWSIGIGVSIDTVSIPFWYSFLKVTPILNRYWVSLAAILSVSIPIFTILLKIIQDTKR
jgi:hypothetical protein